VLGLAAAVPTAALQTAALSTAALPTAALQDAAAPANQTSHVAAARARQENQRQLASCLHHAHRTSVDPAGCRTE